MRIHFNKATKSIMIISGIFIILYFLMRILPDSECGFLHYEEVVNENGEIEYCATNSAGFIDLTQLDYPVELPLEWDPETKEGLLSLKMNGGRFLLPHELAYTHTKQIHLLLIDESLEDYHHIHPQSEEMGKVYRFYFSPKNSGDYRAYAEVVPKRTRRQLIASNDLKVEGPSEVQNFYRKTNDIQGVLNFQLTEVPEKLKVNQDYRFKLKILDNDGNKASLEKIMGAKAHMVAFDAERRGFAHMHPMEDVLIETEEDDDLSFLFNVPRKGWYRLFAQVQKNGESVYARFDLKVSE
ncbi:MAG: hypothetical protein P8I61_02900 [Opitutae bacterium]|nr:hypothetical protein [Opitutae bacterium]